MEKTRLRIVFSIVTLLLVLMTWKSCKNKAEHDNLLNQISQYQNGEKAFKQKINTDSSTIVQQTQTILTQKEAERLKLVQLEGEITVLQSQVRESQVIKYVNKLVPYTPNNFTDTSGWYIKLKSGDNSKPVIDSLLANSIVVPKKVSLTEKWFKISATVRKDGLLIDTLKIENESSVTIGWKKTGFLWFGRTPRVEIKNTNPYLSVVRMGNVVVEKKKGLLASPFFWIGVGIVGGHFIIK